MTKLLFSILALTFTTAVQAQVDVQLTCVAARLSHTLMIVNQNVEGALTVQFHVKGHAVTEMLPLRAINLPNEPQYVFVRKGAMPEYVNFTPGALNPESPNRKSHALVGEKIENLYNCIRH